MTTDPHLEADCAWIPLDLAPRDGTMLWLLMDYSDREEWSPLVDAELSWTIGFNNFDNTEEDRWQSVGWSWTQDFLLETSRRPVAWKPVGFDLDAKIDDVQGSAGPERDAVIAWLESQRSISADAVRYVVHNARIDRLIARAGAGRIDPTEKGATDDPPLSASSALQGPRGNDPVPAPASPVGARDDFVTRSLLSDLVSLQDEYDALNGGGPGWLSRWNAALDAAREEVRIEP